MATKYNGGFRFRKASTRRKMGVSERHGSKKEVEICGKEIKES